MALEMIAVGMIVGHHPRTSLPHLGVGHNFFDGVVRKQIDQAVPVGFVLQLTSADGHGQ